MKYLFAVFIFLMSLPSSAIAGASVDKMATCLVDSSSTKEKTLLLRWIFAAMATHPKVKDLGNISSEQAAELNRDVASLFLDLVTVRCANETKEAFKNEPEVAFSASFEELGRVAMEGLMEDAEVSKYMSGMAASMNPKVLEKFLAAPEKK